MFLYSLMFISISHATCYFALDLDHSSAICKTLYEENASLRSKHDRLLSRLPPSLLSSPLASPSSLPMGHTPSGSIYGPPASRSQKHFRRVSVSPGDLHLLAEQNTELLSKLQQLESEANNSDLVARKKLKSLEKEISLLRDELENTQAKNAELEEQAQSSTVDLAEAVLRKKEEILALKESMIVPSETEETLSERKDFAPSGPLPPANMLTPPRRRMQERARALSFEFPSRSPSPSTSKHLRARSSIGTHSRTTSVSEPQLAVISQLLMKIQELEDTNAQIIEQQKEHSSKLLDVQRETESMSKMYEVLSDVDGDLRLEFADDSLDTDELNMLGGEGNGTMRFRSFRRTLEGGGMPKMLHTASSDEVGSLQRKNSGGKARKSVMGLFGPQVNDDQSPAPGSSMALLSQRRNSLDSNGPVSPMLSTLSFPMSREDSPNALDVSPLMRQQTLHNELGTDWAFHTGNHHLRTTSLYGINGIGSGPPSPSPIATDSRQLPSPSPDIGGESSSYPMSLMNSVLQLTLEPPTPPQNRDKETPTTTARQAMRYRKMSQTVRNRSGHWADSRFKDTLRSPSPLKAQTSPFEPDSPEKELSPSTLVQTLDAAVERVMGHMPELPEMKMRHRRESESMRDSTMQVEVHRQEEEDQQPRRGQLTTVVLELWLWLQFIVIIMVFLYAVAKRGPKAVLGGQVRKRE